MLWEFLRQSTEEEYAAKPDSDFKGGYQLGIGSWPVRV